MCRIPVTGSTGRPRTRRAFLAAVGSGLVASTLAGCVEDTVDGNVSGDPSAFGIPFQHQPDNVQLNPYGRQYPADIDALFFENPALDTPDGHHTLAGPVEAVETDGETAVVTYAEGFSWWNGEPVTARDRWVDERLQSFVTNPAGRRQALEDAPTTIDSSQPGGASVRSVTLRDEYVIEYEFDRPLSRSLALDRIVDHPHNVAAWRFESWLERLSDAGTDEAVTSTVADLRDAGLSLETAMDVGYGCGPYELVEVSPNRVIMDLIEDHPSADSSSIPRLWLPVGMSQQTDSMIRRGLIDGRTGRLGDRSIHPPAHVEQLSTYDAGVGTKLLCNWNNPHLADRNVRRALACVLPIDEIANIGEFGEPAAVQTGLTIPPRDRWLDDEFVERLHRYPLERDVDAASRFMRRGGYERDGGYWRDPDGQPAGFRLRSPARLTWLAATGHMADALEDFGFEVQYDHFDDTTFVSDVLDGNFGLAPWMRDGRPRVAYALPDTAPSTLGAGLDGSGDASRYGKRPDVTTPASPGDVPAEESDREPLDLLEQWRRIRRPTDDAETADAVRRIAAWWNADVPDLDLATTRTGVWGNVRDFEWPEAGDERYRRSGPDNRPELALLTGGEITLATGSDT